MRFDSFSDGDVELENQSPTSQHIYGKVDLDDLPDAPPFAFVSEPASKRAASGIAWRVLLCVAAIATLVKWGRLRPDHYCQMLSCGFVQEVAHFSQLYMHSPESL